MLHYYLSPSMLFYGVLDIQKSATVKMFGQYLYAIYEAVLIYQAMHQNLAYVIAFYAIEWLFSALIMPGAGFVYPRLGAKKSMIWGTFLLAFSLLILSYIGWAGLNVVQNPTITWWLLVANGFLFSLYRMFYWPAYHLAIALFLDPQQRGQSVGKLMLWNQIAGVLAPIIGGYTLVMYGSPALLLLATCFILLSTIPLYKAQDVKPTFLFSYWGIWKEALTWQNLKNKYLIFCSEGVVNASTILWGLFIFMTLHSYLSIGWISAGTTLLTGFLAWWLGRLIDIDHRRRWQYLYIGTVVSAIGWLLKGLPNVGYQLFLADNVQQFGNTALNIAYRERLYKNFRQQSTLADELAIIRQMLWYLGAATTAFILLVAIHYGFSLRVLFVISAIGTLGFLRVR